MATKQAVAQVRCAVYVRVSTQAQAGEDKASLADQARGLRELAEARRWEVLAPPAFEGRERLEKEGAVGVFGDPGISGDTVEERPGMMALLDAVRAGQVGAVLVRDTNRLARSELAAQQIHAALEARGVALVTPAMEYDYSNLQHRLMLGLLGSIEAYAKRWLVMNMRRAREARAQRGWWGVKVAPYGYRWDKVEKRPAVIEAEAEAVREVFRLTADGLSAGQIALELRRRRLPTRYGRTWYESTVSRILAERRYMGVWETAEGVEATAEARPEVVALVTPELFRQVQALRAHHRKRTRRPPSRFLLSGMVTCGDCGRGMTARAPRTDLRYYGCNTGIRSRGKDCPAKHVPAADLEAEVWGVIAELAANPERAQAMAEATERDNLPKWRREVKRTAKRLADLELEGNLARLAFRKGVDSLDTYAQNKQELEQEREDLEEQQHRLAALIEDEELRAATVDRVAEIAAQATGRVEGMDFAERRKLLQRLCVRVVVTADDWSRRRGRSYKVRLEFAGAAFLRSEGLALSNSVS